MCKYNILFLERFSYKSNTIKGLDFRKFFVAFVVVGAIYAQTTHPIRIHEGEGEVHHGLVDEGPLQDIVLTCRVQHDR